MKKKRQIILPNSVFFFYKELHLRRHILKNNRDVYSNTERWTLKRCVINAPGGNRVKTSMQFYRIQPRLYRQDNHITCGNNVRTDEIMTTYNFERTPGLARVTDTYIASLR